MRPPGSLLGLLPAASAQVAGSLAGIVRDPTGARLPGVAITVRGPALQRPSLTTATAADGSYRIAPLPPGSYELEAVLDGFQQAIHRDLRVGVHQDVELDLSLALAAVEETVVVEGVDRPHPARDLAAGPVVVSRVDGPFHPQPDA